MDPSLQPLVDRMDRLSGEFRERREGVHMAIEVAELDPEMALTRARKVLEYVIKEVYERRIKEPAGTRPLENLIQRLVKDKFLPYRLEAYANSVRNLGNVGTHKFGEKITAADVTQSLSQLTFVLEWYFDHERPGKRGATAAGPARPPAGDRGGTGAGQQKRGVPATPRGRPKELAEASSTSTGSSKNPPEPTLQSSTTKPGAGKRWLLVAGVGAVALLLGLVALWAGGVFRPRDKDPGQPPPSQQSTRENEPLKAPDKPTTTEDGIEYIVDKVTRSGAAVTLHVLATNSKDDCAMIFTSVEAVDTDGNTYGGRHNRGGPGSGGKVDPDPPSFVQPRNVKLRKGIKTGFDVTITKVAGNVSEFRVVELLPSPSGGFSTHAGDSPIKFNNVRIGK